MFLSSCTDLHWFAKQGAGQAELLLAAQSVKGVLDNDDVDKNVKRRLQLVLKARNFARDELGLSVNHQYETVTFIDGPAVVYVVTAAPRTSLSPHMWVYPVLGALPYRGYFSLEEAEAHAASLLKGGKLDVDVRPVPTYSLLGVLPDPIVSPMLFVSDERYLVETVIHELAHASVFADGEAAFNEGLATFIGREGSRHFVRMYYGEKSAIFSRMEQLRKDREVYARAVAALSFDLRLLFARKDLSDDELLKRKDRIFLQHQRHYRAEIASALATTYLRRARLPDNNAEIAAYGIYSLAQDLYVSAFKSCNEDWRCFLKTLKRAATHAAPEVELSRLTRELQPDEQVIQ
ncbi:MAG: aminopeptidase [Deltaproteobacteria bacterium]|nr:aminopeptidase [Deltaproteobacteria bacterium]